MVPFLKILKTVFLYSFGGVAARKHKNLVCTDLIRHFGTSFELVLSWGKIFSKGALCIPTSLYFKHSADLNTSLDRILVRSAILNCEITLYHKKNQRNLI